MKDLEAVNRIYRECSPADAYSLCESERLIGKVCMTCKRVYGLVESQHDGGGLSHGWCSKGCTPSSTGQNAERS